MLLFRWRWRRGGLYRKLESPDGKNKLKIKCCDRFTLEDVMNNLGRRLRAIKAYHNDISPDPDDGNIVIIIYTCNAYPRGHEGYGDEESLDVLYDSEQKSI